MSYIDPTTLTVDTIPDDWIKVENNKIVCSECENEVELQTMTVDGIVKADLEEIQGDLEKFPTKIVYGICPICGMEYVFRLVEGGLYVEPSIEEK